MTLRLILSFPLIPTFAYLPGPLHMFSAEVNSSEAYSSVSNGYYPSLLNILKIGFIFLMLITVPSCTSLSLSKKGL